MTLTFEQAKHKASDVPRILKYLRKTTEEEDWENYDVTSKQKIDKWLKAQMIVSGAKKCRSYLKQIQSVQEDHANSYDPHDFPALPSDLDGTLDELQATMAEMVEKFKPVIKRPPPLLSTIPSSVDLSTLFAARAASIPEEEEDEPLTPSVAEDDTSETQPTSSTAEAVAAPTLIAVSPPLPSTSTSKPATAATITSSFLDSNALHTDLADQLASMARQLKQNAVHFSESLVKDQAVLNDTHEKIEQNMVTMKEERVRLRDHRGKTWNTTWLMLASVVGVLIAFVLTFMVIRIT